MSRDVDGGFPGAAGLMSTDDPDYESVRRDMLYKADVPDRRPDVIARARTEDDVRDALALARDRRLRVVCRSSGHNTSGAVLRDDGMLLDVSGLDAITIDPEQRTAVLGPAATNGALLAGLLQHDLGFPVGDCDSVAMGGYLLGGGLGKNGNHWTRGFTSNALVSADLMLADGRRVTVDEDRHPDVFWAMRGCGPAFFAVILSLTVRLFDPITSIVRHHHQYPVDMLARVLQSVDAGATRHDDRVSISIGLTPRADAPGGCVADVVVQAHSLDRSDPAGHARALADAHVDDELRRYAMQAREGVALELSDLVASFPRSWRTRLDNVLTDHVMSLVPMVDLAARAPRGATVRLSLGYGAVMYPDESAGCISPGGRHLLSTIVDWEDPSLDDEVDRWIGEFAARAAPDAHGAYVNQVASEHDPDRIRRCFSPETWRRLQEVRARHDPHGLFHGYLGVDRP